MVIIVRSWLIAITTKNNNNVVIITRWSVADANETSWTFRFLIDHIARQTNITSDIIFDTISAMSNIFSNNNNDNNNDIDDDNNDETNNNNTK